MESNVQNYDGSLEAIKKRYPPLPENHSGTLPIAEGDTRGLLKILGTVSAKIQEVRDEVEWARTTVAMLTEGILYAMGNLGLVPDQLAYFKGFLTEKPLLWAKNQRAKEWEEFATILEMDHTADTAEVKNYRFKMAQACRERAKAIREEKP